MTITWTSSWTVTTNKIVGTNYDDSDANGTAINGTSSANYISGLAGNDDIYGHGGNDELYGDGGNDTIRGGSGDDRIAGGSGNDILIGGAGRDTLWGSSGADAFTYQLVSDSPVWARDAVKDFDYHDVIDLSDLGAFAGGFVGTGSFTGAGQGSVRFVYTGFSAGRVEADVNGDGVADLAIDVTASPFP